MGGLIPLNELASLVNIGTLSAFILISIAVIVMRKAQPDLPRAFRCPGVPYVPILAIISCGVLIYNLNTQTFIRFFIWLVIGLAVYFLYSRKNSLLNSDSQK
jgi:APA family basic amino acid/polyamine antiporter